MAGDAVIKLDLDTGPFDKKAAAAGDKIKKIGAQAPDFSKSVQGMGKMILSAGVLGRAMTLAFDAYNKIADRQAGLSKESGGGRLTRDLNAERAGLGAGANGLITSAGAGTLESRDAVLAGLASMKEGGAQVSKRDATGALRLAATGLYSEGEILSAAKEGRTGELLAGAGKRYGSLSEKSKTEMAVRALEFDEKQKEIAAAGEFGDTARLGDARRARARAESPISGAIAESLGDIPLVGRLTDATERGAMQGSVVSELQEQTRVMKEQNAPRLNLSAGTEGAR